MASDAVHVLKNVLSAEFPNLAPDVTERPGARLKHEVWRTAILLLMSCLEQRRKKSEEDTVPSVLVYFALYCTYKILFQRWYLL